MPEYLKKRFQSRWIRTYLTAVALISYVFTKTSVSVYFMIMMYYSVNDTGILEKKIRVLLSGVEPKIFRLLVRMLYH